MQTINNRMTETQIADLFSLAVQLQVKAEESDDRDTAILAYSIQNACSNLTESQREFRAADATIHNLELQLTEMAVQLANSESKCRELAAENGELKSYRPRPGGQVMMEALDAFESQDDYPEGGMMDAFELLCCKHVETPATDAFLAEVRAQGVEMFGEHVKAYNHSAGWQSKHFAAQLRKGAAL
ncbi:hypothetical protein [Citrobacter sp. Cf068]|uniref:hypothetical protein n=1 Tax=Citrobacter sp. Cf068 TaxID=2985047 RepID=UPI002576062A|nr:hypothetical protein [Citrobacter sp. Cf068]MDM3247376.1 hypothetical protein [Citrobacter sp. Cf068]